MCRIHGKTALFLTAALLMTLGLATGAWLQAEPTQQSKATIGKVWSVESRAVNRVVKDFPAATDLSTPESALAAYHRASARRDAQAIAELSWVKFSPRAIQQMQHFWKRNANDIAVYNQAQLAAEVIEVLTYRNDYAAVVSKLDFPKGAGRDPYSLRSFGKIDGVWKNLGEDRLPSMEAAREQFDRKKDNLWQHFVQLRDGIKRGQPAATQDGATDRSARIAPGEPMGISIEKAELMGRIEWAMMHGMRDITARKSIAWGEVEKNQDGNRTIRYKFDATIWDEDIYVMNQVFTFDAKGNILGMQEVEGFPRKKVEKPVNISTQAGMKERVEDFFSNNFRDVTSRESLEWGDVTKREDGNSSIRYKYRAKLWDRDIKINDQIFTFDPKGKFVSVLDVGGSSQKR